MSRMALRILAGMRQPRYRRTDARFFTEVVMSDFAKANLAERVHAGKSYKTWKRMSFILVIPAVTFGIYNSYELEKEHYTHPRADFEAYKHLRIRSKPFPWGDGSRTLFHNAHYNALPDGYEDL